VVTTTIDLTVVPTERGVTILYRSSDDMAYAGYYSDYITEKPLVALPAVVEACAQAYYFINEGVAFEILLTPVRR
jgi:hypothetical protein